MRSAIFQKRKTKKKSPDLRKYKLTILFFMSLGIVVIWLRKHNGLNIFKAVSSCGKELFMLEGKTYRFKIVCQTTDLKGLELF